MDKTSGDGRWRTLAGTLEEGEVYLQLPLVTMKMQLTLLIFVGLFTGKIGDHHHRLLRKHNRKIKE